MQAKNLWVKKALGNSNGLLDNIIKETNDLEMDYETTLPTETCDYFYDVEASLMNASCYQPTPQFTEESEIKGLVLGVMAALSFVGNTATVISIIIVKHKKRMKSSVYILICHLSVADLFVTFACITTESVWTFTVQWLGGNFLCKFLKYLQLFSLHLSTFILVLIGLDRYYAVKYPMRRSDIQKRIGYGIAFVYFLSGLFSIPQLLVFHVLKGPFPEEFYQCVTYGLYTAKWQEQLYMTFGLVCMFILPLAILTVTYVMTFITLRKSEKVFKCERTTLGNTCPEFHRRRLLRKAKMKALKISVIIVLAFIVCWTPYYTLMIISMIFNADNIVFKKLQTRIFCFGMSNSLVNPIIYGAFHLCSCKRKQDSVRVVQPRRYH